MATVESGLTDVSARERRWAWPALALVLLGGLGLRLWGVAQGLPYVYNTDESDHFVTRAVEMFAHGNLNPHYFANPPAYTYLLHYLFTLAYGGSAGVQRALALHPQELYTLARVAAAVLGVVALWLLYCAGSRLFGRAVGLLAAAIEAVAFLPVFYSHLALNDVPTLAPLTVSLLGTAGIVRKGRLRDYLLAGVGLGLACASKYTAGIVLLPLATAVIARYLEVDGPAKGRVALGLVLAGACALAAFLLANPYAVLDYSSFHTELLHQSAQSAESQGKLGAPKDGGLSYYLWSFTWGLGWLPALAALGGALAIWRSQPRRAWLLVPATLLFVLFMGVQGRYFGRWLLPIFPIVCLLAAFFAVELARAVRKLVQVRPLSTALSAALVAALLAQGLIYSVHSGMVLSRTDTRTLTREWMLANVPKGSSIVVEPVAPNDWAREVLPGVPLQEAPYRWNKYASMLNRVSASGQLEAEVGASHEVSIENYVTTLHPILLSYYEAHRYCWIVSGSTQSGRAFADPHAVPQAIAYYRALERQGEVVYRSSPYSTGHGPVGFNFDWSFDYYPLAYRRPGPQMTIWRLHGGRCGK
jgi:hypothetical protein